jgi:DNA-binding NarL/FixJ family response regulator
VIRLVVVDDDPLVRTGLRMILSAEPDLAVVAEAGDGAQAVHAVLDHAPDVVLMDIRMPGVDGIEATRRLTARGPLPRVLVLTTFEHDDHVVAALAAGASGLVLKRLPPEGLVRAVRTVAGGDALVVPDGVRRLLAASQARAGDPGLRSLVRRLTEREREVLRLLAAGMSNTEISARLTVSPETTKTHVGNVLTKLGARDRTQAVVLAYRSGFVPVGGAG